MLESDFCWPLEEPGYRFFRFLDAVISFFFCHSFRHVRTSLRGVMGNIIMGYRVFLTRVGVYCFQMTETLNAVTRLCRSNALDTSIPCVQEHIAYN